MSISFAMGFNTNLRPPNPLYCIISSLFVLRWFAVSPFQFKKSNSPGINVLLKMLFFTGSPFSFIHIAMVPGYFGIEQVKLKTVCEIIG